MTDERGNSAGLAGPAKGDFVPPPEATEPDELPEALPSQEEFWRPPVRFGSIPVEKAPLGWDRHRSFRKLFPPSIYCSRGVGLFSCAVRDRGFFGEAAS